MTPRGIVLGVVFCGALGLAAWFSLRNGERSQPAPAVEQANGIGPPAIPVRADSTAPYNPSQFNLTIDQSIQMFEQRVADDPQNHLNLTMLGRIYIRKARQDGDLAAYDKAEGAFQRAIKVVPTHSPARLGLAWVACSQHRFTEAVRLAETVYRESPRDLEALAIVGDAQLELGRYAEVERAYRELQEQLPPPAPPGILGRFARLAELRGDTDRAIEMLAKAIDLQREELDYQPSAAWYSMRLGEVLLSQGRYDEAATRLESALGAHANYPAALALLARTRFAQGRADDAIELFKRIMKLHPDLAMLGELGDLYAKTGNKVLAKMLHESVERTARGKPEYDRELALHYCNHDRELPKALELAQRDFENRKDVFAYDTLAWALCKNGRAREAQEAMNAALKLGTKDASLFYHAGVICEQLGERDKAREYLSRAVKLHPAFSITQADKARQLLDNLSRP